MTDREAENRPVLMTRPDLEDVPAPTLPPGVSLRPYRTGDATTWTQIWRDAEPFDEIKDDTFSRSLGTDEAVLRERVTFAVDDATGDAIGTVTAWSEPGDNPERAEWAHWGRVHWVAVVPAWQGRGVGKALLRHCLRELRRFRHRETFLSTSAGRVGAVKLYEAHGFVIVKGGENE